MAENIIEPSNKNELAISIKQNDLADMILNFLGKKETLTYQRENINFILYPNDIEQFYYLLNTKIEKESYSNITHFTVTFLYHDNTKREINGIENLNTFLETRDVLTREIILSWNIILSFPNTQKIENQKVTVHFNITEPMNSILVSIEHTNPVWGAEVLNLFKEESLSSIIEKPQSLILSERLLHFFKYNQLYNAVISLFLIFMLFFIFMLIPLIENKDYSNKDALLLASELINNNKDDLVNDIEVKILLNSFNNSNIHKELTNIIQNPKIKSFYQTLVENEKKTSDKFSKLLKNTAYIFSAFIGILFISYLLIKQNIKYFSERSFILITSRSRKAYEIYKKSKNKTEYYSLSLIAFSMIIGLLVNLLYQFMS